MSFIHWGPIPDIEEMDPNGTPGQTKGGVADRLSESPSYQKEPTAGSTELVPPFLRHPRRDPLATVGVIAEPGGDV